jgi:hypothetical protein
VIPPTPGPWHVALDDGTTVYSDHLHTGVAACSPDPMCREHYQGGPGGNYFAPPDSLGERQANARLISRALAMRDLLFAIEKHIRNGADPVEGKELRISIQEMLEFLLPGVFPP